MTPPTDDNAAEHSNGLPEIDAIAAAGDLTKALERVATGLESLKKYSRVSRVLIIVQAIVGVIAVLAFVISVLVVTTQYRNQLHQTQLATAAAAATAKVAKHDSVGLCIAGNISREQQIGLWEYILKLSGPPKTAQEKEIRDKFIHHLMVVFAPRNCTVLGGGKK